MDLSRMSSAKQGTLHEKQRNSIIVVQIKMLGNGDGLAEFEWGKFTFCF
jgi:hypothetical protein